MSKHLLVIHNDIDCFFTFEHSSFKVGCEIESGARYSRHFTNLEFKFTNQQIFINDREIKDAVSSQVCGFEILVHKNIKLKPYKIASHCIFGCDVLGYDVLLPIDHSLIATRSGGDYLLYAPQGLFLNGKWQRGELDVSPGDYVYVAGEMIFFTNNGIRIREELLCNLAEDYRNEAKVNLACYHRSPRLYHQVNKQPVKIESPATKPSDPGKSLLRIIVPPLIMIGTTIVISLLIGRGLFIIMSVIATLMTMISSIQTFVSSRNQYRRETEERSAKYHAYLSSISIEINLRIQEEVRFCNYHIMDPLTIIDLVSIYSRRIFERSTQDNDFLNLRIGTQTRAPQFSILLSERKVHESDDDLYLEAKSVKDSFRDIHGVGLDISIKSGNLGIVGTLELATKLIKQMLLELITFHSYHDVQLLSICKQEILEELHWLAYAPHSMLEQIRMRGLVYSRTLRDQVLNSFVQIIKQRFEQIKENENIVFAPHYIVTILSSELITNHSISEYLGQNLNDIAISIIIWERNHENLRENINSIIEVYSKKRSRLLINQGEYVNKLFTLDKQPTNHQLLVHARLLRGFNHIKHNVSGLPQTLTFLEMYELNKPSSLNVAKRWQVNDSTKTLAVRLGVTGDNFVELNLHEKAHGPHGLIAGTTGSGKSEIIQSYILSLAVNFSPHEVAFLLIDYKGGGMANLFKELPHLIGTITNLDSNGSMRALVSIKSELLRRQELFQKNNVNHINQYMHLFKQGKALEPMPHLFLIADEFAELKSEQPEFMTELVSTARIGRSLGIHLILATQKPCGVVDSQIWSNSRFKLCLRVQDEADSKEMLKTADAAGITLPGRAYLQVGNNEIYELFQSAWSGGPYTEQKEILENDKRIYQINNLGQCQLLNKDLSIGEKTCVSHNETELEQVIAEINRVYNCLKLARLNKIWLEELQEKYYLDDYLKIDFSAANQSVMLGLVDIPSKQKQVVYEKSLSDTGNIAFIGSSGYGRSYVLMTSLFSLYSRNQASDVYSYILDFGNNALINLRELPHVADYISVDDTDKVEKLIKIIEKELSTRKKLFADAGANHIMAYNQLANITIPKIVIAIDNFEGIKEDFDSLENFLIKLSRDCNSLGIYLFCTALRINSFRAAMINNIKTKIALFNIDNYEYNSIIGKSNFLPKECPGSALVKYQGQVEVMQIFMPALADTDVAMIEAITKKVDQICNDYQGEKKEKIAVVQADVEAKSFLSECVVSDQEIIIGLDYETVEPYRINLRDISLLPVMSKPGYGKSNFARFILMQNIPNLVIFDGDDKQLSKYKGKHPYYRISDKQAIATALNANEFIGKVIITDSGNEMIEKLGAFNLEAIAEQINARKTKAIIPYNHNSLSMYTDDLSRALKRSCVQLIQMEPHAQNHIMLSKIVMDKLAYKFGDVIYVDELGKWKIRIPRVMD